MKHIPNYKNKEECWVKTTDFPWMVDFCRLIMSYPMWYWIGMGYVKYRGRKNNFIFAIGTDMASLTGVISKPSACWWHWWHGAELTFSVAVIVMHSMSNFFSGTACLPDELLHPSTSSIWNSLLARFFNVTWLSDLKYACNHKMYTQMHY